MTKARRVLCPECMATGQTSRVTPGGQITTDMAFSPYYDEQGRYHNHDDNQVTAFYSCSNGHQWSEEVRRTCWCGWAGTTAAESRQRWQEMEARWKAQGTGATTVTFADVKGAGTR